MKKIERATKASSVKKAPNPQTKRRLQMANVKMFIRNVSYRLRQTKDGPTQYARGEFHIEIDGTATKAAVDELTDGQKGAFIAQIEVEQPSLPLGVEAGNAPPVRRRAGAAA